MQIQETPEPFSPAFGEILYTLSLEESEKGEEISIFNSAVTEKIGVKKATDAPLFTLNVGDYVRSQVDIEPFGRQPCGIVEASGRMWKSCIAYRDWAAECLHTAGVAALEPNEPMSDAPRRSLAAGEQDEIAWVADTGTVFARALFSTEENETVEMRLDEREVAQPEIVALILNADDLDLRLRERGKKWGDFRAFSVEIHTALGRVARFDYRIRAANGSGRRLAWWNRYGGVDFHTFEAVRREEAVVERNLPVSSRSRRAWTLATAASTREQGRWLAALAAAPRVWAVEGDRFIPVEVADSKVSVFDPKELGVEVTVVEAQTTEYQRF